MLHFQYLPPQYFFVLNGAYEIKNKKRFRFNIYLTFRTFFYKMSQENRRKAFLALKKMFQRKYWGEKWFTESEEFTKSLQMRNFVYEYK